MNETPGLSEVSEVEAAPGTPVPETEDTDRERPSREEMMSVWWAVGFAVLLVGCVVAHLV